MMKKFTYCLIIGILSLNHAMAAEIHNQNITERRFELPSLVTVEQAARSYQWHMARLEKWNRMEGANRLGECLARGHRRKCIFIPPLPVNTGSRQFTTGWSPISDSPGYQLAIERYQKLAKENIPVNCHSEGSDLERCDVYVNASQEKNQIETIARCRVKVLKGITGAYDSCKPIAILTNDESWVSVYVEKRATPLGDGNATMGRRDFDLGIIGPSNLSYKQAFGALRTALTTPPLALTLDDQTRSITGLINSRYSSIIPGWRETLTFRIDVFSPQYNKLAYLAKRQENTFSMDIEISTAMYLNPQNSPKRSDWRLPTIDQEQRYLDLLKLRIKKELEGLCNKSIWQRNILFCDVQEDVEIPNHMNTMPSTDILKTFSPSSIEKSTQQINPADVKNRAAD